MNSSQYIYAIVEAGIRIPSGMMGLAGAPVSTILQGELAAAISPIDPEESRPTVDNILRHATVVEGLRQLGQAVPVRFGTTLPDEDAVVRVLSQRYSALADDVNNLGDKVEFGINVLWDESQQRSAPIDQPGHGGASPGVRYLAARRAEHVREAALRDRARTLAHELDGSFRESSIDARLTVLPTARLPLRAAYLVDPARVPDFQATFERTRRTRHELSFLLSGPWPPYSFVGSGHVGVHQ